MAANNGSPIDALRADAEAKLDREYQFVLDAAHELRTPLTSVLTSLEVLAAELHGEPARLLEVALRSTRRMRRLVDDLLLLSRADAGRPQPHHPVDLAEVVHEVAAELAPITGKHELSVWAQPVTVLGVRDDLYRLVLNLVENALRHTPDGTQVNVATVDTGREAVLTVQDNGPGVPSELAPRVFERFARRDRGEAGGSGLGLAIVRAVAESHKGSVALERAAGGRGARFVVTLPALGDPHKRA